MVMDLYSCYPEVVIVEDTKFDALKPKLEEIWSMFGIPEMIIHDRGPPCNLNEWRKYLKEMGFRSELCAPEYPQSKGLAEKMMASLAKVTLLLSQKEDN